jgi:hypothetical protein
MRFNAASSSGPISRPPEVSRQSSWERRSLPIIGFQGRCRRVPSLVASILISTVGASPSPAAAATVSLRGPTAVTSGTAATEYS